MRTREEDRKFYQIFTFYYLYTFPKYKVEFEY